MPDRRPPGNVPRIGARTVPLAVAAAVLVPLSACSGIQSTFNAYGPNSSQIARLGTVMFVGGGLILLLVTMLLGYALLAPVTRRRWLAHPKVIVAGGIVFPLVVLSALLIYTFRGATNIVEERGPPGLRIEVIGEQWWWRVRYFDAKDEPDFATANEIRLPVEQSVELVLRSADVIHSFWIPNLAGKLDMIPGHTNRLRLRADRVGILRGQCAEYCGGPHALMAFDVVVQSPDEFERWRTQQRRPATAPANPLHVRGQALFDSTGCGTCHTVRGTGAVGQRGPDLTHVGSRLTIGAGVLPNNVGTIAGWIGANQQIKPGNLMPAFHVLGGEDLRAVAAWLESLK